MGEKGMSLLITIPQVCMDKKELVTSDYNTNRCVWVKRTCYV